MEELAQLLIYGTLTTFIYYSVERWLAIYCSALVVEYSNLQQAVRQLRHRYTVGIMSWGYTTENGPKTWVNNFPIAAGQQQSPVDITSANVQFDEKLAANPLSVKYYVEQNMDFENTGFSVKANIREPSTISGGPLDNTYQLEQFHLHWGSCDERGSEHTVEGKTFPAELHLVHWNRDKYSSFGEAADKPDGLAVFGIFLEVGAEHAGFKPLTDGLEAVKFRSKHEQVKGQFNPKCFLPESLSEYWTYPGSLTTPPCYESVTWIVFKEHMVVSESQLKALRSMFCGDCEGDCIVDNYRPPCDLGSRKVRAAFKQ
ncbi:carbonic anhydrase 2-like [Haliotis rubra]|uniref:carbonic anhydrase 2-like n=1 Tax=Haliotis rubra TaxID=36100 RepID=UPI001EE52F85|nr:carbonic anhydrase 2-like [Haliotis rubra]